MEKELFKKLGRLHELHSAVSILNNRIKYNNILLEKKMKECDTLSGQVLALEHQIIAKKGKLPDFYS